MISRRSLVVVPFVAAAACSRKRGAGFDGYAFVANEDGQAIAAVDLTAFAVIRHVRVDGKPTDVIAHRTNRVVYALTPGNGTVHEISAEKKLEFRRKLRVAGVAVSMRITQDGSGLYVLCRDPRQLVRIDLDRFGVDWRLPLPADPEDFDVAPDGSAAAISLGAERSFVLTGPKGGAARRVAATGDVGRIRFQSDGRGILLANTTDRQLSLYDVETARVITHLPLAVRPTHFCFKPDGGQLFITGEGMDAVVVVYPYHTPQVAETVLAGRGPAAMAASGGTPGYLFVTNPGTGDVTILNITTRRAIAVAAVGAEPAFVTITPDNQYALVLNRGSGDMAVLLISDRLRNRQKSASLFTMIPVGSRPVSAAVRRA